MMEKILLSLITLGLVSVGFAQETSRPDSPKPYPVGQVSLDEIFDYNGEYRERAESYTPKAEALDFLRQYPQEITIEVIYGGWCGDSRAHVPSFIKLLEQANNPKIKTTFVAVDREKKQPLEITQPRHIERVPTFIVYADEQEIGRIIETPEGSVEEHLVKILKSVKRNE
jgi:thiol-disulfide isomerase/thioredoxin